MAPGVVDGVELGRFAQELVQWLRLLKQGLVVLEKVLRYLVGRVLDRDGIYRREAAFGRGKDNLCLAVDNVERVCDFSLPIVLACSLD